VMLIVAAISRAVMIRRREHHSRSMRDHLNRNSRDWE
jgi:hypothetical protein